MDAIFGERRIAKSTLLRYPVGRKFRRNRSVSDGLGDRNIYVFCFVAITINNNTKKAIDPTNLYTKFLKDVLNMFSLKESKQKCNSEKAQSSKAAITQIATKLSSTKSYPGQTIDTIILHINFCETRKHCFPLKCFK